MHQDLKLDPELLRLYDIVMSLSEGREGLDDSPKYITESIIEDIELAEHYAEYNNVDFPTAIKNIWNEKY